MQGQHPARPTSNQQIPDFLWDGMVSCWELQPTARATAGNLYERLYSSLLSMFKPSAPSRRVNLKPCPSPHPMERPRSAFAEQQRPSIPLSTAPSQSGSPASSVIRSPGAQHHKSIQPRERVHSISRRFNTPIRRPASAIQPQAIPQSNPGAVIRRTTHVESPVRRPASTVTPAPGSSVLNTLPGETVRSIACRSPNANRLVPQFVYRPSDSNVSDCSSLHPIVFRVRGPAECGIKCEDAINHRFQDLEDADDSFDHLGTITLCILWPDYKPWTQTVNLKDVAGSSLTRHLLTSLVSQYVEHFIEVRMLLWPPPNHC